MYVCKCTYGCVYVCLYVCVYVTSFQLTNTHDETKKKIYQTHLFIDLHMSVPHIAFLLRSVPQSVSLDIYIIDCMLCVFDFSWKILHKKFTLIKLLVSASKIIL